MLLRSADTVQRQANCKRQNVEDDHPRAFRPPLPPQPATIVNSINPGSGRLPSIIVIISTSTVEALSCSQFPTHLTAISTRRQYKLKMPAPCPDLWIRGLAGLRFHSGLPHKIDN
jgi:hypothetical protein